MTEAIAVSLADVLPEKLEGLGQPLKAHLGKGGPAAGLGFLEERAAEGLRESLAKVDLLEQLARAWTAIGALRAYKDPDTLPPGETAVIPLGEHHLSFTATPTLKLKVGGVSAPDLKFTYEISAALDNATLSVRDGALVAAAPGPCAITAALSCGEVPLHPPFVLSRVKLPEEMRFVPGWPIP